MTKAPKFKIGDRVEWIWVFNGAKHVGVIHDIIGNINQRYRYRVTLDGDPGETHIAKYEDELALVSRAAEPKDAPIAPTINDTGNW